MKIQEKIFTKQIETGNEDFKYIVYSLKIPNQKEPWFIFKFKDRDSLEIAYTVIGGNGNGYDFNFFYDSRKLEKIYLKKNKYIKNKITIDYILNSNLEIFHEVLKKANKIYILEETDKKGYRYLAREVNFSIP